jgi:radical SAM-linked protein
VSNETIILVIKFRIWGNLRYLSHAQMLRLFQRACVRAGMEMQYSRGFNPRPRLSLPLPRPVGVASDDELLCLRVRKSTTKQERDLISKQAHESINAQLPQGCELLSVNVDEADKSFQPVSAAYVLKVRKEYLDERLKATIERLLASKNLNIRRYINKKNPKFKNIDVRGFLKSIELERNCIIVECKISSAGSIRVDEILTLLGLDIEKLASPIRRKNVQWQVG